MIPDPVSAIRPPVKELIEALPRYTLHHCNDMGDDYMSRCYMVAEPDTGGESVMAGRYKWIRADELLTVLTGEARSPQPEQNLGGRMIEIQQSQTADTRTCDYANVSKETLLASSKQHIGDVGKALAFFRDELYKADIRHDTDKITDIDTFHRDFVTGFQQTEWWDRHRQLNRHHLTAADGVRDDVNLIDVLDFIADCVMAGMARSGSVYPLNLPPELLEKAFQNTVELLKANVRVVEPV
jgi:hypothetical protein